MTSSNRFRSLSILLSAVAAVAAGAPAHQAVAQGESSALFAAGTQAFQRGDYVAALDRFRDARAAGGDGPSLAYNIGVTEYRLGQFGSAERSFRELATNYPTFAALARYNIGLVHLARGETAQARRQFESVQQSGDATLRDLATAALSRTELVTSASRRVWSTYIDASAGHDSNVALLEDSVLPAGSESSSGFLEALAFASGPAGAEGRWLVDVTGYAVSYFDTSEYNQLAVSAGGLRTFTADAWTVRAGPVVGAGLLDGDGFERRAGVQLAGERAFAAASWVRVRTQIHDVTAIDDRFGYLEGERQQVDITWLRTFGAGRLSLNFSLESNDRAGAGVSPDRARLALTYRFAAGTDWVFDPGIILRDSDYDDLATPRSERLRELGVFARRALGADWQLSIGARFTDNSSTDPVFDYSRTRITVGVNRVF